MANSYCHNVVMRLDFAVDGIKNTICEVNYENKKVNNPYGNVFIEKKKVLKTEKKHQESKISIYKEHGSCIINNH